MSNVLKRFFALMLCICLFMTMFSGIVVFAEDDTVTLCEHHPQHTEKCGYKEAVEGKPCTHKHDETCGFIDSNGESTCSHEHDEICGYVEAIEGHSCEFVCKICNYTIVDWEWDDSNNVLMPASNYGFNDVDWVMSIVDNSDDVLETLLPSAITATLKNGTKVLLPLTWNLSHPKKYTTSTDDQIERTLYSASLPEGYTLDKGAPVLTVLVQVAGIVLLDNPITTTKASSASAVGGDLHFIVRHWHSSEDTNTSYQGDEVASSNGRYFVVAEGYIHPLSEGEDRYEKGVYEYEFYLVPQSDGEGYKKGERVRIGSTFAKESDYIESINRATGTIELKSNPLFNEDGTPDETFSAYSITAGHSAASVDYDDNDNTLRIKYDPYVHLVKAHAYYIDVIDNDDGAGDDEVFFNPEKDVLEAYVYTQDVEEDITDNNITYSNGEKGDFVKKTVTNEDGTQTTTGLYKNDTIPSQLKGKVQLKEFYSTTEGLHTNKTASAVGSDGRTFDLDLESWYSEGEPPEISLILDASGSMAFASDLPSKIELSDEKIQTLGIKKVTNGSNITDEDDWSSYLLTDDQLNDILDINNTDNSTLGVSGYSYFIKSAADEYAPLGYWEGIKTSTPPETYEFVKNETADVTTGWPTNHNDLSFSGSNGFRLNTSETGILLNPSPTGDEFTVSFTLNKVDNNDQATAAERNIAELLYIGPMSGNTADGGYYRLFRDQGTSSNRLRGNQNTGRGNLVTDFNNVFNTTGKNKITLVFKDGKVTSYLNGETDNSNKNQVCEFKDKDDIHIIINGIKDTYNGAELDIIDIYVFDRELDENEVSRLDSNPSSFEKDDKIIGLYKCLNGSANHSSFDPSGTGRDWLLNSIGNSQDGPYASKLIKKIELSEITDNVFLKIAKTWDGRVLGSLNVTNSDAKGSATLKRFNQAGWYFVSHAGNFDTHYAWDELQTGKRLFGVPGTTNEVNANDVDGYGYIYDPSSDIPTQFYINAAGQLCCFYGTSGTEMASSYVYELKDNEYIRTETLQRALGIFTTELSERSPTSKVSAVRYSTKDATIDNQLDKLILLDWTNDPKETSSFLSLKRGDGNALGYTESSKGTKQYNYGLTGTTATDKGVQAYVNHLKDGATNTGYKYLLIFTDGNDNGTRGTTTALLDELKNKYNYTIFTVLLEGGTMTDEQYEDAEDLLTSWAGKKKYENGKTASDYFFSVTKAKEQYDKEGIDYSNMNDADILTDIFTNVILDDMVSPLTDYTVKDYIDPRFDLVDKDGTVWHLNAGGSITQGEGNNAKTVTVTDSTKVEFTVKSASNMNDDATEKTEKAYVRYDKGKDMYYLEWTEQTIPSCAIGSTKIPTWEAKVTIKAKDDFIGGNAVLSNGNEELMNYVYSEVDEGKDASSGIEDRTKQYDEDGNVTDRHPSKGFPRTSVNVTPPRENLPLSQTIYMGETLDKNNIAKNLIEEAYEKAGGDERLYWEYIGRFVNYFNSLKETSNGRAIIDSLHEINRSGETIASNEPDSLEDGHIKIISNRIYDLIYGTNEYGSNPDYKTLSIDTLSELLINKSTVIDSVGNYGTEQYLYLPYIYLPDSPTDASNSTGTDVHLKDVIGYLYFHVEDTDGKDYPSYPEDGTTKDTLTRMSRLKVSFAVRSSDNRKTWNNKMVITEEVYKRDTDYKPAVGKETKERQIVINGTFTTHIVSGEIALQINVSDEAANRLKEINKDVTYTADLYRGDDKVGTFNAVINAKKVAKNRSVQATIKYDDIDGYKMSKYGLPLGEYTLQNGEFTNADDGFTFGTIKLIDDEKQYKSNLFKLGVGNNTPNKYIATTNDNAFILGYKNVVKWLKALVADSEYTNYRFGLYSIDMDYDPEKVVNTPEVDVKPDSTDTNGGVKGETIKTGDDNKPGIWLATMVGSFMGLAVLYVVKRRKKDHQ